MRKITTLFSVILLTVTSVYATHIKGGEIYYDHVQGNTYDVFMVLYRDVQGASAPGQVTLNFPNHPTINSVFATVDSTNLNNIVGCANFGIDHIIYKATVNLGALPAAGYVIEWNSCCRPYGGSNIAGVGSKSFRIWARIKPDPGKTTSSSSPRFHVQMAYGVSDSLAQTISGVAYDPDPEDSIYVELTDARDNIGALTYSPGFSAQDPFGVGASNTHIDSLTGLITANGMQAGGYVVALKVSSYRNGVHTSSVRRDVVQYVVPSSAGTPGLGFSNISTTGSYTVSGNTVFVELNDGDTFSMLANGTGAPTLPVFINAAGVQNVNALASQIVFHDSSGTGSASSPISFTPNLSNMLPDIYTVNYEILAHVNGSCAEKRFARLGLVFRIKKNATIWHPKKLTLCKGDSAQAFISGDTTNLEWSPSAGVSDPFSSSPWISPDSTTTYTITNWNDSTTSQMQVIVKSIPHQVLGSNGTEAYLTNKPHSSIVVWYYSGVAIAMNVDTIMTPASGEYFATIIKDNCTYFSDTVTIAQGNSIPLSNQGGSTFVANGSGQYTVRFTLNQHDNVLNAIHLALADSGFYKTGSQPEINLYDDQQQLIASSILQQSGTGLWKAANLNVSLAHSMLYTLMVKTHTGKVALFKPAALPYTEANGIVTVNSAGYQHNGVTLTNALPYLVFDMVSGIGIEETQTPYVVYPNPVNDRLNITVNGSAEFKLFDMTGKLVLSKQLAGPETLNTDLLPPGVYIYQIHQGDKVSTGKLTKQ